MERSFLGGIENHIKEELRDDLQELKPIVRLGDSTIKERYDNVLTINYR